MNNKHFTSVVLLGATIFFAVACTDPFDEFQLDQQDSGLEVVDGTLKVSSFEIYESLFSGEKILEKMEFLNFKNSLKESIPTSENYRINDTGYAEISLWEDDLFLEILDQDGFVVVDDILFRVDFNNRVIVASTDLNLKSSILDGNLSNDAIRLFSFDDDVIGLIENGSQSTIPKQKYNARITTIFDPLAYTETSGCDWSKCDNSNNYGDIIGVANSGGETYRYRFDAKHTYAAAGISFKLFSKGKHMRKPEGGSLVWTAEATTQYIWWDYEYLSKKNGSTLKKDADFDNDFDNEFEVRYYSSSRGLEKFYLRTQFYAEAGGNHGYSPSGTYWQFNLKQIDKGY